MLTPVCQRHSTREGLVYSSSSNLPIETLIAAERFGDDRLRKVIGHFVTRAHPLLQGGWEHDQSHVGMKAREQIEIALADPKQHQLMKRFYEEMKSLALAHVLPRLEEEDEEEF